jgi:hypothetical protein
MIVPLRLGNAYADAVSSLAVVLVFLLLRDDPER